jgi:23S rRNA (uridine2552-2'-O)-methyltransferase
MAGKVLKPGGGALIKLFQGTGFQELTAAVRRQIKATRYRKPAASRARSAATCLLASGLRLV